MRREWRFLILCHPPLAVDNFWIFVWLFEHPPTHNLFRVERLYFLWLFLHDQFLLLRNHARPLRCRKWRISLSKGMTKLVIIGRVWNHLRNGNIFEVIVDSEGWHSECKHFCIVCEPVALNTLPPIKKYEIANITRVLLLLLLHFFWQEKKARTLMLLHSWWCLVYEINTIFVTACSLFIHHSRLQIAAGCCHATRESYIYSNELLKSLGMCTLKTWKRIASERSTSRMMRVCCV